MINPLRKVSDWWTERKATEIALTLMDDRLMQFAASYGGGQSVTGRTINDDSAMRITAAFACVRVIAETLGEVTLAVYERQKNGNAEKVDHDLGSILIDQPNADMTGYIFREAMGTNLAARGNAYSFIEQAADGKVLALNPIPSKYVTPVKNATTGWQKKYRIVDRGKTELYPVEKVWHWKGFGYNGIEGLSPIGCAREALGLSGAGEEFNARLFANGLYPSIILKPAVGLKPDQMKLAQERIEKMHSGLINSGKPYLLPPGTEIAEGIFAPKDAQFLELRRFQISELARIWRISPHMIADLDRATNNNIEQLSLEFVQYTMLPYFRRIEEECRQLFTPVDRKRFFVRFNFESLLRADSAARAELYSIMLQNGVLSRNEVRGLENRNTVDEEGMDDHTVQVNMTLIDMLDKLGKTPKPTAPAAPAAPEVVDATIAKVRNALQRIDLLVQAKSAQVIPLHTPPLPEQRRDGDGNIVRLAEAG